MCDLEPNNPVVGNLFTGVATFIIISLVDSIVVEQHPSRNMPPVPPVPPVPPGQRWAGWAASSFQCRSFMMWWAIALVGKELCLWFLEKQRSG
jgi:hypothetical protein